MEPTDQSFTDQLNHTRLINAYLRLAAETKRISESPGIASVKGEAPKPKRKPKKDTQQLAVEQLRLF